MISWTKTGNMLKAKGIATVLRTFKNDLVSLSVHLTSCIPSVFLSAREEAWEAKVKVQDMIDWLSIDNRNWKGEVTPHMLYKPSVQSYRIGRSRVPFRGSFTSVVKNISCYFILHFE